MGSGVRMAELPSFVSLCTLGRKSRPHSKQPTQGNKDRLQIKSDPLSISHERLKQIRQVSCIFADEMVASLLCIFHHLDGEGGCTQ